MRAPIRKPRPRPDSERAIYSGRARLGEVVCRGGVILALDAEGVALGEFPSLAEAAQALVSRASALPGSAVAP